MEIGSIGGMQQGFQMGRMGGRRPPGDPEQHAAEMSARLLEEKDSDGDGMLSATEFEIDSEKFAKIDEDGDGLLTQDELETGALAKMEEMKARFEAEGMQGMAGMMPPGDMGNMQGMSRSGEGDRKAMAAQTYGLMQESFTSGYGNSSSEYTNQYLDQLNMAV